MDTQGMDLSKFVGQWTESEASYNTRDAIIYALGIGCSEQHFIYENDPNFAVFPTIPFALLFKGTSQDVLPFPPPGAAMPKFVLPGTRAGLDGERFMEQHGALSAKGMRLKVRSRIVGVHKRGKAGALVESETEVHDAATNIKLFRVVSGTFMVGAHSFQDIGTSFSANVPVPDREADKTLEMQVGAQQAQLYRLSGDYNPLHVSPPFAKSVGFGEPILHGLCTLGFTARAVVSAFANNDPSSFRAMRVRFSSPVLPGQMLVVKMWVSTEHKGRVLVQTFVKETNKVVINHSYVDLDPSLPTFTSQAKL